MTYMVGMYLNYLISSFSSDTYYTDLKIKVTKLEGTTRAACKYRPI